MYKLSAVTKNYAKGRETVAALRGVDLVIEDGEWLAIQGPTGHGKSTLLQILGGLDRPSGGIVDFDGRDLAQLREAEVTRVRATSIGFVFQTFNLVPTLSAQENVEAALVPLHVSAEARRQRAAVALAAVGLGDRLQHVPGELSGGQQQRVAIARALVKEPKVLLADEPTGNLDEDTRDEIIGLLEAMWAGARPDHGGRHPRQHRGPPRPAHRRDEERPPELPAAGPGPHGGAAPAPRSPRRGIPSRRRMINGVIRDRAAAGGCPAWDNRPGNRKVDNSFRWLTETKLFPSAYCRGTRI